MRFYPDEKLETAISEWRHVVQFDSKHERRRKNIEQPKRLLKGLQPRKQKVVEL